ncbi:molybdate ABC transporter substrate-binding protein [Adlercreutzia shanghongiae]|uniref:Extracellular solute-binding protein n=1 Tax=Adlercreutzia shanghongiae TaxID=3111773 RepID=A0ABU6J1H3_9ACTN|nr:extracellular solute-binding protein [Adlercreutzia sp. R22]MEC4295657.1 extracellular solute-binding protein [Adlercreutzia sp. R22]
MKNITRRMFAAVSATMMVAALGLGGCASDGGAQDASANANETQEQAASEAAEGEPAGEPVELQIFAANSLTKAMAEAQALYHEQHPEVTFADTQYEGSGTLVEMLGAGQYADVLITASAGKMDDAAEAGYIAEDTRRTMFNNDLVIVTEEGGDLAGKDISLEDIAAGAYTLAVGDESVPAGNYACQALTTVGGYIEPDGATGPEATGKGGTFSETLKPMVTLGGKVGDVCKYAETGEVDIAMVYTSDVYRMGGVAICTVVPGDTHKPITYPGAVCAGSKHTEAAQAFIDWCMTDEDCAQIWEEWGFERA